MNLRFLFLLFIVASANLATADGSSSVNVPIKFGVSLAPRATTAEPSPVTLAPRATPAQPTPVTLAPRQSAVTQAPAASDATPVAPPEIPSIPKCNPRDPYNPKYSTDNITQIDHALLTVTGYARAFNTTRQLVADPVTDANPCQAAIRRTVARDGTAVPQILINGCTPAPLALPARACQAGNTIKFLVDGNNVGGILGMALPSKFEVSFSRSNIRGHWMVQALGRTVHVIDAPAARIMH